MDYLDASDSELLLASADDDRAFRVVYDRYADQIRSYHLRRCRDDETAFDLVAETFAQAWCVRRAFRDEADGSAAPWLYGIARNVLRQSVRRERLEESARQRLGILEQAGGFDVPPQASWLEGADELLDTLPAEQRRAVELRVVEDLTYERVADRLAITPQTARMRVHRALKTLRERHLRMTGELRWTLRSDCDRSATSCSGRSPPISKPTLTKLRFPPAATSGRGLRPAGDGGWQRPP